MKTVGLLLLYMLLIVVIFCFFLFGAQLAFLIQLPNLPALIQDGQSVWLVFSTWPTTRFGLFLAMAYFTNQTLPDLSQKPLSIVAFRHRLSHLDRRHIVVFIGASIFLSPLLIDVGLSGLLYVATVILCAVAYCLFFRWALKIGAPLIAVVPLAGILLGFAGNLLMADLRDESFRCETGSVQLRTGTKVECDTITGFSRKPLWLIQNEQDARLIARHDLDFKAVLQASTPTQSSEAEGATPQP